MIALLPLVVKEKFGKTSKSLKMDYHDCSFFCSIGVETTSHETQTVSNLAGNVLKVHVYSVNIKDIY